MARGQTIKQEETEAGPEPASSGSRASKRKCVQSACVPCRKRKSKVGESAQHRVQWSDG